MTRKLPRSLRTLSLLAILLGGTLALALGRMEPCGPEAPVCRGARTGCDRPSRRESGGGDAASESSPPLETTAATPVAHLDAAPSTAGSEAPPSSEPDPDLYRAVALGAWGPRELAQLRQDLLVPSEPVAHDLALWAAEGCPSPYATDWLAELALDGGDPRDRSLAIAVLGRRPDPAAADILRSAIEYGDPEVAMAARMALQNREPAHSLESERNQQ